MGIVEENQERIKYATQEATEEYLNEIREDIFQRYPEVESINFELNKNSKNPIQDFNISMVEMDGNYSFRRNWKESLINDLTWAFDLIDTNILKELYCNENEQEYIGLTENGIEIGA